MTYEEYAREAADLRRLRSEGHISWTQFCAEIDRLVADLHQTQEEEYAFEERTEYPEGSGGR